jgi:hypothetical protein
VVTERLGRRLVAVMFTDMVGYTAQVQADERALADVTEPADFLPAIADTLDVKEAEGRSYFCSTDSAGRSVVIGSACRWTTFQPSSSGRRMLVTRRAS